MHHPNRDLTPYRPWEPLNDAEWAVLAPYVACHTAGRPIQDPRGRLDAIFWLATGNAATRWADLPEGFAKPDTVSRQFRRWAQAGLWTRLLHAIANRAHPGRPHLERLASWICRAYRRAWRILGIAGILVAKRLGFLSALRGPPWLLPDPDLSDLLFRDHVDPIFAAASRGERLNRPPGQLRSLRWLLKSAAGRGIPRALWWP